MAARSVAALIYAMDETDRPMPGGPAVVCLVRLVDREGPPVPNPDRRSRAAAAVLGWVAEGRTAPDTPLSSVLSEMIRDPLDLGADLGIEMGEVLAGALLR